MPNSVVSLAAYSVASVIDQKTISYFFQMSIAAGNYQLGGIPLNFNGQVQAPGASALAYPIDVAFRSVSTPPSTYTYKFNPLAQQVANITNFALTSNVGTVTANNLFVATQVVVLAGLTTSTFLNGQAVTIASATATSFTFAFTHADVGTGAETGTATIQGSAPNGNSGTVQIYTSTTEQAGGATPAAAVADQVIVTARFRRG